jgi:hypothetical protein
LRFDEINVFYFIYFIYYSQNGIRWPDIRSSGVSLRSQRTKLPLSVGLKKTKAIECMLKELAIDLHPPPTGKISMLH